MRNLTDAELEAIAARASLWIDYGDRDALRPDDVLDLITELREQHELTRHLTALVRQARDQLADPWAAPQGAATAPQIVAGVVAPQARPRGPQSRTARPPATPRGHPRHA